LPGMVASETALPVVGVPVKGSVLDGVDSLYSIVQMPVSRRGHTEYILTTPLLTHCWLRCDIQRGIPTATVGINNSTNAALLAIRIIAASDPKLLKRVEEYAESLEEEVLEKVDTLEQMGWEAYAAERLKK
jgi:phosphoribosylaminoimidazole carboxylase